MVNGDWTIILFTKKFIKLTKAIELLNFSTIYGLESPSITNTNLDDNDT